MSAYINFNGKILPSEEVFISPNNRSFRYGDGFFDTMRFQFGEVVSAELHVERIQTSLSRLQFEPTLFPDAKELINQVQQLTSKNAQKVARVRCTVFRGDGALYDDVDCKPNYLIQSWSLNAENNINKEGFVLDIYYKSKKAADEFSSLKSNNFLPYVMAALYAKKIGLDDCILLNTLGNVTDTTIANVFVVKNEVVTTPPLTEGPVAGTMREYLMKCMKENGMPLIEYALTTQQLMDADEVFLTNAVYGLRWVKAIGSSNYSRKVSFFLYEKFIKPLFDPR